MSRPLYQQASSSASSSSITPTSQPPPPPPPLIKAKTTLRRGKTLTRPERQVAQPPLITPPAPLVPGGSLLAANQSTLERKRDWWVYLSLVTTFWAPPALLASVGGMRDSATRQAWREKITLVGVAVVIAGAVAFVTMGLDRTFCPGGAARGVGQMKPFNNTPGTVGIGGYLFNITSSVTTEVDFYALAKNKSGQDTTNLFLRSAAANYPSCLGLSGAFAATPACSSTTLTGPTACPPLAALNAGTLKTLNLLNTTFQVGYSWGDVINATNYIVVSGHVLNLNPYLAANPKPIADDRVDSAIRYVLRAPAGGKDATKLFQHQDVTKRAVACLTERYRAGHLDKITPGCFASALFLNCALGVILSVILIRFVMACIFNWFIAARMVIPPKDLGKTGAISPMVMPAGANASVDNPDGAAPWRGGTVRRPSPRAGPGGKPAAPVPALAPLVTQAEIGLELFTVILVTCYSESLASIKGTCDSLAATDYADGRKLLFIVADGMVTGDGEAVSTPDICVGLLEPDERFGNPMPMGYLAVGSGRKKENRAMVYAGHYVVGTGRDAHRVPTVVVVKCGMPSEANDKKPGNRGKRDSQLILMNFFSRVTYNDRMTPLDYDLFRKVQILTGVTPDFFELCLMVDADTVVYPESMRYLVNTMQHDRYVMGVCGETRVANKRQSWVTMIQVYEYFISHHQAKAFESVFGGVTCLPGCFSMYRLKARKLGDDDWVPVLTLPDVVREYAQDTVTTLHQKNLLLLGEDRFLSTLLLRTFPNRKMLFCPQARCRTVAPDTFAVLLSQRRRWINSTIHNLCELVRVRNLCGTFCFSMQFVVFMDLVGTVSLPIAICLTLALIINSIITPPTDFESAIPLMLLASVLFLPAVLIMITTGKLIYCLWMFVYLLALPIWNFVLPVYSFWHFDDFSWGETRKVAGEGKGAVHDDDKTQVAQSVPLRRWEDWERTRLRRLKREERRKRDIERMERAFYGGEGDVNALRPPMPGTPRYFGSNTASGVDFDGAASDTTSVFSSEDDQWGVHLGAFNEHATQYPPPPLAFDVLGDPTVGGRSGEKGGGNGRDDDDDDEGSVNAHDLEALLDQGFDDPPSPSSAPPTGPMRTLGGSNNPFGNYHALPSPSPVSSAASSTRSLAGPHMPRFALSDGPRDSEAYEPPTRSSDSASSSSNPSRSTAVDQRSGATGHARQRSAGQSGGPRSPGWGPGGPLLPAGGGSAASLPPSMDTRARFQG